MKITISGDLGSGKSTVAKAVSQEFNLKHYSIGDFMREIAKRKNVTLLELSKIAEQDNGEVDNLLDKRQKELYEKEDDFILDSRLGWHFLPKSIKIFLKVDVNEAARRIFSARREDEKYNTSLEKTKENILKRRVSENKRYKEYYNIELPKEENFDLVVDTTNINAEKVILKVKEFLKKLK